MIVFKKKICVCYLAAAKQIADVLTKPFPTSTIDFWNSKASHTQHWFPGGVMTAHWLSYIFFYCLSWKSPHPSVRGSKLCLIIWFVIAFMSFLQLFQFFNLYGVGEPRVTILLITYLFKSSLVLILPYIWWHHRSWGYWFNSHLG